MCRVLDVNDNPPEVVEPRAGHESTITLHLHGAGAASKVAGETIGGVRARDADSGVNAELRYAIEPVCRILERSSDPRALSGGRAVKRDTQSAERERDKGAAMSERALSLVRVEVATGKLYLARPLEATDAGAHRLCVRISDGGRPQLETLTELLLVIRNGSTPTAESFGALDGTAIGATRRNAQASDASGVSGVGGKVAEVGHRMAAAVDRVVWKEEATGDGGGSAVGSGGELDWRHVRPTVLWLACTLMLATLVLLCALVTAIAYRRSKDRERMSLRIPHEFAVSQSAHNHNHHRFHSNSNQNPNPNSNSNGTKAALGARSSSHRQLVRRDSHSNINQNVNPCQVDCYESRSPARSVSRAVRPARLSSTARLPVSASAVECSQRTPRSPYLCVEPRTPLRKQSTNSCVSEVTTREPSLAGVELNSRNEHAIVYRVDSNEHSIICRVNSNERSIVSRLNSGNLQRMDSAECEETFSHLRRHMSLTPDLYSACLNYEHSIVKIYISHKNSTISI